MKAIVISEKRLEEILEETKNDLELAKFKQFNRDKVSQVQDELLQLLHRNFNYHVYRMIDKIKSEY